MLEYQFASLVYKLDDHRLVRILDVEDDGLVPDGSCPDAKICLSVRFILPDLNLVLGIFQV